MTIKHYDLFAGIGGFSLALEEVFPDATIDHIFCEWERFPTSVLRQHWPDGEFWGDIAELVTHTGSQRRQEGTGESVRPERLQPEQSHDKYGSSFTIVTGGFPCQPFSAAGRRRGTADDRYQWPNMFEIIRHTKPEWVIAENVRGLVTWNEGMVLETVCADLESEGYEVQPFIIPAVAVGAPHRRDRVWIIAHRNSSQANAERQEPRGFSQQRRNTLDARKEAARQKDGQDGNNKHERHGTPNSNSDSLPISGRPRPAGVHTSNEGASRTDKDSRERGTGQSRFGSQHELDSDGGRSYPDWSRNWQEVAFATCDDSVDDGLSRLVDGVPYSRAKWRKDSLKAYGNGIVPEVAMQIMKGIRASL